MPFGMRFKSVRQKVDLKRDGPGSPRDSASIVYPAPPYSPNNDEAFAPSETDAYPQTMPPIHETPVPRAPPADILPPGEAPLRLPWRRSRQERERLEAALREQESLRLREQARANRELRQMQAERDRLKKEKETRIARKLQQEHEDEENEVLRREMAKEEARKLEEKQLGTSPADLLHLRELVRSRYDLDMEIWRMRDTRKANRRVVLEKMRRADDLLNEIQGIVRNWRMEPDVWDEEEMDTAKQIRRRLLEDGKRVWRTDPPWETN